MEKLGIAMIVIPALIFILCAFCNIVRIIYKIIIAKDYELLLVLLGVISFVTGLFICGFMGGK